MDGWNRDGWSGNGFHMTRLLYLHLDSKVSRQGKGGRWSKASTGILSISTSTSKHLWLQRWGQVLILNVIRVNCWGRCRWPGSCVCRSVLRLRRKAIQNALDFLLHFVCPVDKVVLQLASFLHDPLLPFPEPGQQVQPFVNLTHSFASWGAGRSSTSLWPVGWCLARHVEIELLRAQVQWLAVQLLNEGHRTALRRERMKRVSKDSWTAEGDGTWETVCFHVPTRTPSITWDFKHF